MTAAEFAELRKRCELEERKHKNRQQSDIEGCARSFVEYFRQNPTDRQLDEILYNAGVMFEEAKSMSAAAQAYTLLRKYFPHSKLAARALAREGKLYSDVAMYDRAATLYEEYAKKYAGEKDAYDAMSDAVYFRRAIGDDDKTIEDTKYFIRTFGTKKPREAANAHFSLTSLYEKRGDRDSVIKHLREYIRQYGGRGGDDRLVIAHAKIGQLLWEQSCPVKLVDGVCARVQRAKKTAAARCGAGAQIAITVVERDQKRVVEAFKELAAAVKHFEKTGGRTGGDDAGARYYYASAKLTVADHELEKYLSLAAPGNLMFEGDDEARRKSLKRFEEWIEDSQKRGAKLLQLYEQLLAIKDAATSIAAAERIGRVTDTFATALMTAELPAGLRTGANRTERAKAYCDQLATVGEPLRERALMAYGVCLSKATELGWFDDAARSCERALLRMKPEEFPALREVSGPAMNVAPVLTLEPPLPLDYNP